MTLKVELSFVVVMIIVVCLFEGTQYYNVQVEKLIGLEDKIFGINPGMAPNSECSDSFSFFFLLLVSYIRELKDA